MSDELKSYPIPILTLSQFQGGRFYHNRYVYSFACKWPCIPSWWSTDIPGGTWGCIKHILNTASCSDFPVYSTGRRREVCGTNYRPATVGSSDEVLGKIFGLTTLQSFYRRCRDKKRVCLRKKRSIWCIPWNDRFNAVLPRYRGTWRNESEHIPLDLAWLFDPLDITDGWPDREPEWDKLEVGPDRKPMLYSCNLCSFSGEEDKWKWGSPFPGLESHQILFCPNCKERAADILDRLDAALKNRAAFRPTARWQDDYILNF